MLMFQLLLHVCRGKNSCVVVSQAITCMLSTFNLLLFSMAGVLSIFIAQILNRLWTVLSTVQDCQLATGDSPIQKYMYVSWFFKQYTLFILILIEE